MLDYFPVAPEFYIPTCNVRKLKFVYILSNTCYYLFFIITILVGTKWYVIAVLICITNVWYLITNDPISILIKLGHSIQCYETLTSVFEVTVLYVWARVFWVIIHVPTGVHLLFTTGVTAAEKCEPR